MPTHFPLPLRNALAATILEAFDDAAAVDALTWLTTIAGAPTAGARTVLTRHHLIDGDALLDVHAPHADRIRAHAVRGLRAATALTGAAIATPADTVVGALHRAAALWAEGLFFEVHEILEAVWSHSSGGERIALQGLIQIAVAFHHHAHGNPRGAKQLLRDGRARLAAEANTLPLVEGTALLDATAPWEAAFDAGHPLDDPSPVLRLRSTATPTAGA